MALVRQSTGPGSPRPGLRQGTGSELEWGSAQPDSEERSLRESIPRYHKKTIKDQCVSQSEISLWRADYVKKQETSGSVTVARIQRGDDSELDQYCDPIFQGHRDRITERCHGI